MNDLYRFNPPPQLTAEEKIVVERTKHRIEEDQRAVWRSDHWRDTLSMEEAEVLVKIIERLTEPPVVIDA